MPCDLEIDTQQIRLAATWLELAALLAHEPTRLAAEQAEPDRGSDGSAPVRAALNIIATRSQQCLLAGQALAQHAASLSERLSGVADAFDRAESLCAAGW